MVEGVRGTWRVDPTALGAPFVGGVLQVHAVHQDAAFTSAVADGVQAELEDLASWLGLSLSL